jgi:hypothetical protein
MDKAPNPPPETAEIDFFDGAAHPSVLLFGAGATPRGYPQPGG